MPQFLFLNEALDHFLQAIQNVWAPVFQMQGIQILLGVSAIAFAVYAIQLIATHDVPGCILGFSYTIISLAVLHAVFLYSQEFATSVLNAFLQWGQQTSGMSPNVLRPSGVMETGLQLARIFWTAAGHASWFHIPFSFIEAAFCSLVVVASFGFSAIIYLLALVQVWALIISASVLLAFAPLPWTWNMFPGWALTVLSASVKVFFLLAVLALGLNEAAGWTATMSATSGTILENASLTMEAMVESVLLLGLVYYIPNLMASMVMGGAALVMNAGEAVIASAMGSAASAGVSAAAAAPGAAIGGAMTAAKGAKAAWEANTHTVAQMLLR